MADLSITANNVQAGTDATREAGTAGATVTAGQAVYKDTTDGDKFKLSDNDGASALIKSCYGIALNGGASGQPLTVQRTGPITIGAVVTVGERYFASATPGGICPSADLTSGKEVILIGVGISATQIQMPPNGPWKPGAVVP